jgi:hypothetical protein
MAEGYQNESSRFVPPGVDAQTWIGFEQRIQERRYKALLETINGAITRRDGIAARAALEEARELRPAAPELTGYTARVALLPTSGSGGDATSYVWTRGLSAAAMLLVGIGLMLGIEARRSVAVPPPVVTIAEAPAVAAPQPATSEATVASAQRAPAFATGELADAPAAAQVPPAVIDATREEPVGTAGVRREPEMSARAADTPNRPTFRAEENAIREPILPASREVSDDDAAARARSENRAGLAEAPAPSLPSFAANVVRQPVAIAPPPLPVTPTPAPALTATPAAASALADRSRVSQVLNQYARAYDDLNPAAARAVWPTVDERALSRAFASLESQDVSFSDCSIDVSGTSASASCRGRASYVGKVGSRERRTEPREWNFQLRLDGEDWKIEKADTRRLAN